MNVHPATLSITDLLKKCSIKRIRRSGPGGQHRNKVATAVIVTHRSSGVIAEANERRSPEQNRQVALFRLRLNLALKVRTQPTVESVPSQLWRGRCHNRRLRVNSQHDDFPTLLAELLDMLAESGWSLSEAAAHFDCSTSQLLKFLKQEPRALTMLNDERHKQGLSALK